MLRRNQLAAPGYNCRLVRLKIEAMQRFPIPAYSSIFVTPGKRKKIKDWLRRAEREARYGYRGAGKSPITV
jgi:hypothetical protein